MCVCVYVCMCACVHVCDSFHWLPHSFAFFLTCLLTHSLDHLCNAAAEAYISGDWACITRLGLLLLNSAFIESDPVHYSPSDEGLQHLYQGLKLLVKLYTDAFSETGVRYALDMERTASLSEKQFRERRATITGKEEPPLPISTTPHPSSSTGESESDTVPPLLCKPCI